MKWNSINSILLFRLLFLFNLQHHQFKFQILLKLLSINKLKERLRMICLMDIIYGDWNFKSWILCTGFVDPHVLFDRNDCGLRMNYLSI